jgi:hypothetical protein
MTLPDLSTASLNTLEETMNPQQGINSIDMGFTLVDQNHVQRSPLMAEVRSIRDIYRGIRDVLHFPPYYASFAIQCQNKSPGLWLDFPVGSLQIWLKSPCVAPFVVGQRSHVDHPNDRFFTIASHGVVLGAELVNPHATPDGRIVAIVDKHMGYSDICWNISMIQLCNHE